MDYKQLGVYSLKKDSTFNGNFLKVHDGYKYEILEFPIGRKYTVENSTVLVGSVKFPLRKKFRKIFASDSFLFICYDKLLEIYELGGSLVRKIESSENIICGTGGFLVFDRVDYILNRSCETVFVTRVPNIIDFTDDGVIMSIDCPLNDGRDGISPSNPRIGMEKGNLIVQSMNRKALYNSTEEPIANFGEIAVYSSTANIDNIIACSNIKLETLCPLNDANPVALKASSKSANEAGVLLDCIIVLCKNCVFVMYDDLVVRKQLESPLTHIIPERFVAHNYVQEVSIYDCILTLNCFRTVRLFKSEGVENFLVGLMNSGNVDKRLYESFIDGLRANESPAVPYNTILCRVYRQVDDKMKGDLDRFITIDRLSADELYYLIIYKPDLTERFVQLCKKEKRLFYLDDLRLFFEKTSRADELKKIFLRNGVLIFEYDGLSRLIGIERNEINAQKACFLASVQ